MIWNDSQRERLIGLMERIHASENGGPPVTNEGPATGWPAIRHNHRRRADMEVLLAEGLVELIPDPTNGNPLLGGSKLTQAGLAFLSQNRASTAGEPNWSTIEMFHTPIPIYDVFISHASEDKDTVVRPLANALQRAGLRVWYDEFVLEIGDSLREQIDRGILDSKFGIVVLSEAFFNEGWPKRELDGITSMVTSGRQQSVLPIWHGVDHVQVMNYSPPLADVYALRTQDFTTEDMANSIARAIRKNQPVEYVYLAWAHSLSSGILFDYERSEWPHGQTAVILPIPKSEIEAINESKLVLAFPKSWGNITLHTIVEDEDMELSQIYPPSPTIWHINSDNTGTAGRFLRQNEFIGTPPMHRLVYAGDYPPNIRDTVMYSMQAMDWPSAWTWTETKRLWIINREVVSRPH